MLWLPIARVYILGPLGGKRVKMSGVTGFEVGSFVFVVQLLWEGTRMFILVHVLWGDTGVICL